MLASGIPPDCLSYIFPFLPESITKLCIVILTTLLITEDLYVFSE